MRIVVFHGYSGSGKTQAIVVLVRELVKQGRKVGTLKSIHDSLLTIDTEGKDTWLHAAAGASVVVALLPNELTTIEKRDTSKISPSQLFDLFERRGVDYLIIEGLYRKLLKTPDLARILCARSNEEAAELLEMYPSPICILTRRRRKGRTFRGVPMLHLPEDTNRMMDLLTSPAS